MEFRRVRFRTRMSGAGVESVSGRSDPLSTWPDRVPDGGSETRDTGMSYKFVKALGRNYSSRSRYGHGSTVKGITIHHWGSTGQKHANVVAWLRGYTGNRGSSAH